MRAEELWDMAAHFRELAFESMSLKESIDLCKLAGEYEAAARDLEATGERLSTSIMLPA